MPRAAFFQIGPADQDASNCKQFYWPDTNVLVTRFLQEGAAAELIDFMPVGTDSDFATSHRQVIRRVTAVRGNMRFRVECRPAFNYARDDHKTVLNDGGAEFHSAQAHLGMATSVPLAIENDGAVAEFSLGEGQTVTFVLRELDEREACGMALSDQDAEAAFRETVTYWRDWLSQSTYRGRWREMVDRSALALKLLTYEPTGAIVAAPTCSLPEGIGGERNWDYRYTWLRDSAFTVFALLRLGFTKEAQAFAKFIEGVCADPNPDGSLQIMYGIDGRKQLIEESLDHLDGYMGSRPVRIGNGAYNQLQLDIYGELMDSMYLFNKHAHPIGHDAWLNFSRLVDWVCDNWQRKDEGIWEVRGGQQEFVYSKLMCWVALDRGLRIAGKAVVSGQRDPLDQRARREFIWKYMKRGWNEELGAFVQHYGSDTLDASNLMLILTFFLSPADPRTASFSRCNPRVAGERRARLQQPRLPLQRGKDRRWAEGRRGYLQHLHLLAGGRPCPRRQLGPDTAGRGTSDVRTDARLRQPSRPVCRGDRAQRRGARQLPAGLHPPGPDQRRHKPRTRPRRERIAASTPSGSL